MKLKQTIVYNLVESTILRMIENVERFKDYYKLVIDKEDITDTPYRYFEFRYVINFDRFIHVYVEEMKIVFLLVNKDNEELDRYVVEEEELCDSIYC